MARLPRKVTVKDPEKAKDLQPRARAKALRPVKVKATKTLPEKAKDLVTAQEPELVKAPAREVVQRENKRLTEPRTALSFS